jgi:hypothetical protein
MNEVVKNVTLIESLEAALAHAREAGDKLLGIVVHLNLAEDKEKGLCRNYTTLNGMYGDMQIVAFHLQNFDFRVGAALASYEKRFGAIESTIADALMGKGTP